jgi:hypothetical protein
VSGIVLPSGGRIEVLARCMGAVGTQYTITAGATAVKVGISGPRSSRWGLAAYKLERCRRWLDGRARLSVDCRSGFRDRAG